MRSRGSIVGALLLAVGLVAPVARAATIGYTLTISDTTVQVGDAMTLTPVVTGADPGETLRCEIWIEHYDGTDDWVRMHVASMGCEPWTFVVPPGPIGQYEVVGRLYIGLFNGAPTDFREVIQTVTLQAGGTPKPFTTNYPVQSWDLNDIVSTGTPKYGEPLTIYPPATGDDCDMRILGGLDYSHILQRGGCDAWTFSIPERNAQGPGTVLGQTSDVQVMAWTGDSPYAMEEPEAALVGERFGETYVVNLQDFTPGDTPTTEYTSNLPAIFQGIDRGYTGQSGENTEIEIAPAVAGTTEGTCILPTGPSPVVPGGCEDGVTFQAWQGEGSAQAGHHLELRGTGGELLSYTDLVVAWVEDMSALQVDAPDTAQTGVETDIDAGTETGAPSTYEVIAEPVITGTSRGTSLESARPTVSEAPRRNSKT